MINILISGMLHIIIILIILSGTFSPDNIKDRIIELELTDILSINGNNMAKKEVQVNSDHVVKPEQSNNIDKLESEHKLRSYPAETVSNIILPQGNNRQELLQRNELNISKDEPAASNHEYKADKIRNHGILNITLDSMMAESNGVSLDDNGDSIKENISKRSVNKKYIITSGKQASGGEEFVQSSGQDDSSGLIKPMINDKVQINDNKQEFINRIENSQQQVTALKSVSNNHDDYQLYKNSVRSKILGNLIFPIIARKKGIEGTVEFYLVFNTRGEITNIEIKKSSGYKILDDAARKSIIDGALYKFPDGIEPVSISFNLPISFKLTK